MNSFLTLWIWVCAYLNFSGWILSGLHQLNSTGYTVAVIIGGIGFGVWQKVLPSGGNRKLNLRKIPRRFRRAFPLAFLSLTILAFLGGALYAPTNYDALAYRLPRVLQWLSEGRWHWIHSIFERLNNRSCGIEWVSAPVLAFFKSDRPLFLINLVSFLFLPGLIYSSFTRLGVKRRVAWYWMWILPTGYGFLLQAGSIGNDLFGAVFAVAAVDFALRARQNGSYLKLFTSILAAALMTAAKTNNLPLLLPWAVALWPSASLLLRRRLATAAICLLAIASSVLPTAYFNQKITGDWSGAGIGASKVEHAMLYRTGANAVALTLQNLVPPLFPWADQWNRTVKTSLPLPISSKLESLIEIPGCWFPLTQMQIEENAGLGFGVTALLAISALIVILRFSPGTLPLALAKTSPVLWGALIAFLACLSQANLTAIARLFIGYYLFPAALVLTLGEHGILVRSRWWQSMALVTFLLAGTLLIISPARPLFPRQPFLKRLHSLATEHPKLSRLEDVYSVYSDRNKAFTPLVNTLPPGLKTLGYIAYDRPETSLWHPLGSRRIVHVCPSDTAKDLKSQGVEWILVNPSGLEFYFKLPLERWLEEIDAECSQSISLRQKASEPAQSWLLVHLH